MLASTVCKKSLALAFGVFLLAASGTVFAGGDRVRLECRTDNGVNKLDAEYERQIDRGVLREQICVGVEFEDGQHRAGDLVQALVGGASIGMITLQPGKRGAVDGDLCLSPSPVALTQGTSVQVENLSCSLNPR